MKNEHDRLDSLDACERLRRLCDAIAGPPPDEEESRRMCAELGIDVDAMYERVMAQVRAHVDEAPPESGRRAVESSRVAPVLPAPVQRRRSPWSVLGVGVAIAAATAASVIGMHEKLALAPGPEASTEAPDVLEVTRRLGESEASVASDAGPPQTP